jgi:predicted GNAT family acetyltransferase
MGAAMQIEHDSNARRFVAELPVGTAYLAYARADEKVLDFYSTFVPPPARGQNVAAKLVEAALGYARENGFRIIPSCWYVALWIQRHPEHDDLIAH